MGAVSGCRAALTSRSRITTLCERGSPEGPAPWIPSVVREERSLHQKPPCPLPCPPSCVRPDPVSLPAGRALRSDSSAQGQLGCPAVSCNCSRGSRGSRRATRPFAGHLAERTSVGLSHRCGFARIKQPLEGPDVATAMLSLLSMAFLPLVPPSPLACEPVSLSPLTLTGLNLSLVPLSLHFSPGLCGLCPGSHLLRLPSAPRRPVSLICPLILSGGVLLVPSLSNDFLVRSPQFSKQFKPSHQHSGISALV